MFNLLHGLAERTPDAPMIIHGVDVYTFEQVASLAIRGASWLETQGIGPGDKVVIAVSNRPLFLFYWFSLLARGAVGVPISHDTFGKSLRYVVEQSESKAVVTEDAEAGRIESVLTGFNGKVLSFLDEAAFTHAVADSAPCKPAELLPQSHAAILYTSGTTGQPKGAIIPVESYIAAGREIVEAVGITARDRILTFLPLHHANPQMYAVMSALTAGCSVILISRFSASGMLAQAAQYGATGFTYVGTVLSILSKTIDGPRESGLRWCVGGGAPESVWRDLTEKLGLLIHELYGMTETGGITTINSHKRYRVGSVGYPRDDFEVALLDENDHCVTSGIGEIAVRPKRPWVISSGYYNKPDETIASMANLWFHTGDFGRFDAEGYLYFEGRKKELIRRAGEMISPVSIELAAARHPCVADCAAVPVPDPILGEEIKLVIVAKPDIEISDLMQFLKARLPRHEIPRYIDFAEEIPKTPTQKIQRFKLKASSVNLIDLNNMNLKTEK